MKKLMSKFDIFSCSPVLRAEGESQVMNLCGSLFSILIFGFFTYIFFNNIISTVQLQNITSSQTTETVNENNKTINNVVVGVGLQWMSLVDHQHIFQLSASLVNKAMNMKQINVFPCTREVWKDIDDSKFQNLALDHHMCVEKEQVQLFGQNGAPSLQSLYLRLSICDPLTSPVPCANSTYITNFLATQKIWSNRFFACSLAVLDVGFNPSNQNPITYTVYEKTMWLLFNFEQQIVVQMFLGTYHITTDTNFMPVTTNQQMSGYFVSQAISGTLINSQLLPVFVQCFLFTSPINFIFERTYGKLDEVLSYVGGLYGILISFFAFFLMSFNQYRYQLRVSEGAFSFKEGYLARQSDLHFGKYLKYAIYDWVKTLFCYQINWRDCKAIDEARAQAIEQIDIKHLLKRISHLQKINSIFVNSQVETALYLAESNSIQQVKHRRNIVQYCEKFTQLNKSITISVYQQANALFQFANNLNELNQITPDSFQTIQIVQYKELEQFESLPSLKLMNQYCSRYVQKFKINNNSFNLTQQDIDAQQEISQSFYALQESIRMKLIKKIPLGILYRIRQSRNSKKSQKNERLYKTEVTQQNKTMNLQRNRKNRIINSYDTNMNLDLKF